MKIKLIALALALSLVGNLSAATKYWFKTGANANWSTRIGNWWDDSGHSSQSAALPSVGDACVLLGPTSPIFDTDSGENANDLSTTIDSTACSLTVTGAGGSIEFYATVTGNVTFIGAGGLLASPITGNVILNGTWQTLLGEGSVSGNETFNGSSYDSDPTHNVAPGGTLTFTASVVFTIADDEWQSDVSSWVFNSSPAWIFNSGADNAGNLTNGTVTFNGNSQNNGTVTGDATFTSASTSNGNGNITGKFISPATHSGNLWIATKAPDGSFGGFALSGITSGVGVNGSGSL